MDNVTNIEPADNKERLLKGILEELAQGGGGGGDFTTATMSVVFHDEDIGSIHIYAPGIATYEIPNVGEVECISPDYGNIDGSATIIISLYKGYGSITIDNPNNLVIGVDSGNATIEVEDDIYYVLASGDFTLGVYAPK